jgi:hypothetical protein
MFAIGSVGSLVLSPVIGRQVRRYKAQHALRVPVVVALVLVAAALVLALTPN